MADKTLAADPRESQGTSDSRRSRLAGKIPAVVYGGSENLSVLIDAWEFGKKFKVIHENEIITLKTGNGDRQVLIKDYQYNAVKDQMVHIDFLEVQKGHTIKTHVPIHLNGTAKGVRLGGGILESQIHELEIECLPKDLPETIEVDVSDLDGGHALHVRDLAIPQGVKVLTNEDQVVASITHAKSAAVAEETEEAAEGEASES